MTYTATMDGKSHTYTRNQIVTLLLDYCTEKYGQPTATKHTMVLMGDLSTKPIKLKRKGRVLTIRPARGGEKHA